MEFINWGTTYHAVAQEFVAWSRRLEDARLIHQSNTIVFEIPDDYDYSGVFELQLLYRELLAFDIRKTIYHVGEITGEITTDDLLANIFSKFCIGK